MTGKSGPEIFMKAALTEAEKAADHGEVPVGAVTVREGRIIARAGNMVEELSDPTAHAEILVLRKTAGILEDKCAPEVDLYVTLEPCAMCAGAILLARVKRLYYGVPDPKTGAVTSRYQVLEDSRANHQTEVHTGILEKECRAILETFFKEKR